MRRAGIAIAIAAGLAVAAAAQSRPADTAAAKSSNTRPAAMTVTGCLERAREAETPTTGVAGARRTAPAAFVLINAGSASAVQASGGGITYILEGGSGLAEKVGRRVEVKGTPVRVAATSAPSTSAGRTPPEEQHEAGAVTGGTPGAPSTSAPAASSPHLRVASVRAIGDCSSSK
jgi:hypothetical protein